MSWISERLDRLRKIVAECIHRGFIPSKVGWADLVNRVGSSFGVTPLTIQGYIKTLADSYSYNQWLSYVQNNDYLTKEEREAWIKTHGKTREVIKYEHPQ